VIGGLAFGLARLFGGWMLVQIKFIAFGCCSAIGNFEPNDTARVSAAMARHLVEEARCAKYVEAPVSEAPKPRKRKGR
jgi:hypothetical protein